MLGQAAGYTEIRIHNQMFDVYNSGPGSSRKKLFFRKFCLKNEIRDIPRSFSSKANSKFQTFISQKNKLKLARQIILL